MGLGRTDTDTFITGYTVLLIIMNFPSGAYGFRVMAPGTFHIAALQKYGGSYPRPIV
jgi:hypothetical protein